MADNQQVVLLREGITRWNEWRQQNPNVPIRLSSADLRRIDLKRAALFNADLSNAYLAGVNLFKANLTAANLTGADLEGARLQKSNLFKATVRRATLTDSNLSGANLFKADLSGADLKRANLNRAYLYKANLAKANLSEARISVADMRQAQLAEANLIRANLNGANLNRANLSGADLTGALLEGANVVKTNLTGSVVKNCRIYGISAWDPVGDPSADSGSLIVTPSNEPSVTVDDLEIAQFVYLLLDNSKIRTVIDTVGKKGVLILGRFTPERKEVLDAIRRALRRYDYVPMIFDFDKPTNRDFTETIMTLAGMSRFIVADITNPKSSPLELQATVPNVMVPFVPIIQKTEKPFSMFQDLYGKFDWVLEPLEYDNAENLIANLREEVIDLAEDMADELAKRKAVEPKTRKIRNRGRCRRLEDKPSSPE